MINIINVFVVPFLFALIGSSLFVAIPLFILKLGVTDPFMLGMAGVAFQVCYIPFCVLHSIFSKRINRKKSLIIVSVIYPIIILGFILTQQISIIFFLCALLGITLSLFWPTYETHISVNLDQCRATKNLQGFNMGWASGSVLGCALGGLLFTFNVKAVFYFDFIMSLIAIYLIFRYVQENFIERSNSVPVKQENSPESSLRKTYDIKQFLVFGWMAAFCVWFSIGIIVWLFPKFATDSGMSPPTIGFLRATLGLFQAIIFFVLGLNHRWQYSVSNLVIYELMLIFGFIILMVTSTVAWWALSFAIIGISAGFVYSSSLFYSSQAKTEKGEKTGFHEAVITSGMLFGTFFGGIISRTFSAAGAYSMCIGLMTLCIILQLVLRFNIIHRNSLCSSGAIYRTNKYVA